MTPLGTLILLIWAVGGIVAATRIGQRKGRPWTGFILGLFLGWIGATITVFIPATREMRVQRERERLEIQREAQTRLLDRAALFAY